LSQFRVIPELLFDSSGLVKGRSFGGHEYVGDPLNTIKILCDFGASEIIIANRAVGGSALDFNRIASWVSISNVPVAYSGTVQSMADADELLHSGFEKIVMSRGFFTNPQLLKNISHVYGAQSTGVNFVYRVERDGEVVLIDWETGYPLRQSLLEAVEIAAEIGIGEIYLTNVDREGLMEGLDYSAFEVVKGVTEVPVVIGGGVGDMTDLKAASKTVGLSGVTVGSYFTFIRRDEGVLIRYENI